MFLLTLFACLSDRTQTRGHPPRGFDVHGIDVSHHQGWIDWDQVGTTSIQFAFIKATEGRHHVDRRFEQNWEEAMPQVKVGAYHYFSACHTGASQAAHFLAIVPLAGTLPSVLDVELDPRCNRPERMQTAEPEIKAWLDAVEAAQGVRPMIYGSRVLLQDLDIEGDRWSFWQYTNAGRVPGIAGPVDRNVFDARVGMRQSTESLSAAVLESSESP